MWEDRKQTNSTHTNPNPHTSPTPSPTPTSPLPPRNASPATSRVAVIGRNMLIIGKVQSSEDLYVDGEVRGALEAENCRLTIGPHGKASAGARAREVDVLGRIDGNVETQEKISIRNGGQLVGDIKAAGIVIEDGAYFKGSIDIIRRGPENGARKETAKEAVKETAREVVKETA